MIKSLLIIFIITNLIAKNNNCFAIKNIKIVKWDINKKNWILKDNINNSSSTNKLSEVYRIYFINKNDLNDRFYKDYNLYKDNCELIKNDKKMKYKLYSKNKLSLAYLIDSNTLNKNKKYSNNNKLLRNVIGMKLEDIK